MKHIDVRGRFVLIFVVTFLALWAWWAKGVKLGQDLKGGTSLTFSLDIGAAERQHKLEHGERSRVLDDTIKVIQDRIDKFGLSETSLSSLGEDKFVISLPAGSEGQSEGIVDVVTALGDLQFQIEVLPRERYSDPEKGTPPRLQSGNSQDWPWPGSSDEFQQFKEKEFKIWSDAHSRAVEYVPSDKRYVLVKAAESTGSSVNDFHVLENSDDAKNFTGKMLRDPVVGEDPRNNEPVVLFKVKLDQQRVFGEWTERNKLLPMAIILNGEYHSAPRINDKLTESVQITLGTGVFEEKKKEAQRLATVLQTGSLKVRPQLESRNKVGAKLAGESKDRGILATIVAFLLVLGFMVFYYRGAGFVANLALLLNLVLLVGTLSFFGAAFSLPGIAGIVLTLGMAVDANILINERIREEMRAGRTIRRALSEGYARALTTIVDANLTSIITAIFLFMYGTGPIKGFAISLAVGLCVSMFTAIYVTRTVFEWGVNTGRVTEFKMFGTGKPFQVKWMQVVRILVPISTLLVVLGLAVFIALDPITKYDIDFTGGFKLQARFTKSTSVDDVKKALDTGVREVTVVRVEQDEQDRRKEVPIQVKAGPYGGAEVLSIGTGGDAVEINVQRLSQSDTKGLAVDLQGQAFEAYARQALAERLQPDWMEGKPDRYASKGDDDPLKDFDGALHSRVTLYDPVKVLTPEALATVLRESLPYYTYEGGQRSSHVPRDVSLDRKVEVKRVAGEGSALPSFDVWIQTKDSAGAPQERESEKLRQQLGEFLGTAKFRAALVQAGLPKAGVEEIAQSEPFPSLDLIGASVAQRLRGDALIALVLSMIGIIVYVAIRFNSKAMGFSAVLCLFHDVAISLGVVALANLFGLVDAKINLAMVAAILTLVGFSVNDTVVVFDRIRENRGKKPAITAGMVDDSINQTVTRSIKTSATFFLVCLALFALNIGQRNVLEGFAFFLMVGSLVGTYSSIAIASPLLLFLPWFWKKAQPYAPKASLVNKTAANALTVVLTPFAAALWVLWWAAFGAVLFAWGIVAFPLWALQGEPEAVTTPT